MVLYDFRWNKTGRVPGNKGVLQKKISDYWASDCKRASDNKAEVMFRNGYSANAPSFIANVSLDIKTGREEWGAEPGKKYYTLHIHKIGKKLESEVVDER